MKVAKIINISLCYLSILIVISAIYFPIPVQKAVKDLYNYHTITFLPFKQFIFLKSNPLYIEAANLHIRMWASDVLLFIPMGFMIKSHIKKFWLYIISFILPALLSFGQCLLMIILKCNYKNFQIEEILFYILGFILGILLNKFFVLIIRKVKTHSNIINFAYYVLSYRTFDELGD